MLVHLKIMAATASCTLEDAVTGLWCIQDDKGKSVSCLLDGSSYLVPSCKNALLFPPLSSRGADLRDLFYLKAMMGFGAFTRFPLLDSTV